MSNPKSRVVRSESDLDLSAPLLRAEQIADLLAIKTSTVFELSRRQHDPLPCVGIGRSKRFSRPAVARWVLSQTNT